MKIIATEVKAKADSHFVALRQVGTEGRSTTFTAIGGLRKVSANLQYARFGSRTGGSQPELRLFKQLSSICKTKVRGMQK